ncbi:hypothetical protein L1987_85284 [Smallanthus sonchifolius]|uniref:Uncharacterized protein n=1 Tax=Smallanthus sonchifolius TaxID=185202 RepID=A0ACB8XVJ8_9ASTR|nr:hypothetical protein L1987_85284 [Smallanthus sonchifolius]
MGGGGKNLPAGKTLYKFMRIKPCYSDKENVLSEPKELINCTTVIVRYTLATPIPSDSDHSSDLTINEQECSTRDADLTKFLPECHLFLLQALVLDASTLNQDCVGYSGELKTVLGCIKLFRNVSECSGLFRNVPDNTRCFYIVPETSGFQEKGYVFSKVKVYERGSYVVLQLNPMRDGMGWLFEVEEEEAVAVGDDYAVMRRKAKYERLFQ